MLRKWLVLRPRERSLFAAGAFWVLAAHALLRSPLRSFAAKQRAFDALAKRLPRLTACTPADAAWAVTAVARRVPGTVCLPWALALRGLLLQAGIESELRIGVASGTGAAIKAHAWVDCEGQSLSWNEPIAGYSVLRSRVRPS
jgi:hypothetical protein